MVRSEAALERGDGQVRPPPALTERADLLAEEAKLVCERGISWRGRLNELGDYGRAGGSALDRRTIVEYLAAVEAERHRA